jgi:hypothetical protein
VEGPPISTPGAPVEQQLEEVHEFLEREGMFKPVAPVETILMPPEAWGALEAQRQPTAAQEPPERSCPLCGGAHPNEIEMCPAAKEPAPPGIAQQIQNFVTAAGQATAAVARLVGLPEEDPPADPPRQAEAPPQDTAPAAKEPAPPAPEPPEPPGKALVPSGATYTGPIIGMVVDHAFVAALTAGETVGAGSGVERGRGVDTDNPPPHPQGTVGAGYAQHAARRDAGNVVKPERRQESAPRAAPRSTPEPAKPPRRAPPPPSDEEIKQLRREIRDCLVQGKRGRAIAQELGMTVAQLDPHIEAVEAELAAGRKKA